MSLLSYKNTRLRALEHSDLDFLFAIENNQKYWSLSNTQLPYSKHILAKYIENAHLDIYETKQYRFVIVNASDEAVGLIDLFNFDPTHRRAGVGILVLDKFQHKGFGSNALKIVIDYAFSHLQLHQLYANILATNTNSIQLFNKYNFEQVGIKKDWIYTDNQYTNEVLYQLINTKL